MDRTLGRDSQDTSEGRIEQLGRPPQLLVLYPDDRRVVPLPYDLRDRISIAVEHRRRVLLVGRQLLVRAVRACARKRARQARSRSGGAREARGYSGGRGAIQDLASGAVEERRIVDIRRSHFQQHPE